MLLNFGTRVNWLKIRINRNRGQSHAVPASVTLQLNKNREPQKPGRIRISLSGDRYKYNIPASSRCFNDHRFLDYGSITPLSLSCGEALHSTTTVTMKSTSVVLALAAALPGMSDRQLLGYTMLTVQAQRLLPSPRLPRILESPATFVGRSPMLPMAMSPRRWNARPAVRPCALQRKYPRMNPRG